MGSKNWTLVGFIGTASKRIPLPELTKANIRKAAEGFETFQMENPQGKEVYTTPITPAEYIAGIKQ